MGRKVKDEFADLLKKAASRVTRSFQTDPKETLAECWVWALDVDQFGASREQKLRGWLADGKYRQAYLAVVEGVGRNGFGVREKAARLGVDRRDLDRRNLPAEPDDDREFVGSRTAAAREAALLERVGLDDSDDWADAA